MRTVTSGIIPCRLFVSSHLLSNPLAASAEELSQTDSSTKRRGGKALSPGSRGDPEAGELCWVFPGSLQASSILPQRCWQPGTATGAVGERENPNPWARAPQISQLHLPGKQNTAKYLRLLTALRPCWSLWVTGTFGRALALRSLSTHHCCSVQLKDFPGQTTHSTRLVHDAFQPSCLQSCCCSHLRFCCDKSPLRGEMLHQGLIRGASNTRHRAEPGEQHSNLTCQGFVV